MEDLELTALEIKYREAQQIKLAVLEQLKEDLALYGIEYVEALINGYIKGLKWTL